MFGNSKHGICSIHLIDSVYSNFFTIIVHDYFWFFSKVIKVNIICYVLHIIVLVFREM